MKRCPHCEFIYEDEQSLCDMDGQALVYDQVLSVSQPQASVEVPTIRRSWLRGVALPGLAGLLLATLISLGYYASTARTHQSRDQVLESSSRQSDLNRPTQTNPRESYLSAGAASAVEESTQPPAEPVATQPSAAQNTTDKTAHAHLTKKEGRLAIPRTVPPLPRLRPLPRLPTAKPLDKRPTPNTSVNPSQQPRKPDSTANKKESKLGTFLKKTGRVLTKPFKL